MDENERQFRNLRKIIDSQVKKMRDLEFQRERRVNQMKELNKTITELEEKLDGCDKIKVEKEVLEKSKKDYKKKYQKLRDNPKSLDADVDKIKSLEGQIQYKDKVINDLREGKKTKSDEFQRILNEGREEEMKGLRKKFDLQEQELNDLQDKLDECNAKFEELDGFYGNLKNKYKDFKREVKEEKKRKEQEEKELYERAFALPDLDDFDDDEIGFQQDEDDEEELTELDFRIPELEEKKRKKSETEELYERVNKEVEKEEKQKRKETKEFEKKRKDRLKEEKKKMKTPMKLEEEKVSLPRLIQVKPRNLEEGKKKPKGKLDP